jgi:uncharacterized membrane protein
MKAFKDFLYDKNDIIIALAILLIAGLIITWRMEVIMDYPQTLAEETDTTQTTEESAVENPDQIWIAGVLTRDITVKVEGGSASSAAQCLINAGLFTNYDQFAETCKSAGRNPENIKANTFTFEKGSTQADIAKKVTD